MNTLIIGGSTGISKEIARLLNDQGHTIYTACRTATDYNHQDYDVTSNQELQLPEQLDQLVYAPGSINLKPFHRIKPEDFLEEFQLNALGAVKTIQQALPLLKKSEHASILLFSTVAVQTGMNFHASIAMAKGAIEGLTRSLAAEYAPKIRVNAIAPTLTDTPLSESLTNSDDKRQAAANRHPLKTIVDPADLAHLGAYLLSDKARFLSGQIIQADAGLASLKPL